MGGGGPGGGWVEDYRGDGDPGVEDVGGLFDMKLTLSVWHNYLKLKMIIWSL